MIKLVALDIDGVLTDGSVMIDSDGKEHKQVSLKDIDAVFELHRRGFQLAAVTGEDTDIVGYFEKGFHGISLSGEIRRKKRHCSGWSRRQGLTERRSVMPAMGNMIQSPLHMRGLEYARLMQSIRQSRQQM